MRDCRRTGFAHPRDLRRLLLIGCAGISLVSLGAEAAGTLPSGGHFAAGSGGIAAAGGKTTITQSSTHGIIDWKSFSIGKGNTVQFDNGSGATLNEVTGGNMSTIAGQLKATGSVYLINQNGVVIGPGGKVVTGGSFVASTRPVSDGQFMAGGTESFTGGSNGSVVNDGAVVSQSGSVVLIGHAVTNNGTIGAANGKAALASGNRVVMSDANGPGRVYVAAGKSGDTSNDGQVKAAAVELASAGGNVYALAGNRTGLIRATGTKTVDGQVWLTAPDGAVDVAGTVKAANADGSGGAIVARGDALKLENKAVLNAAGSTGRGTIETSGRAVSIGKARVTAGRKGQWMIDPTDLTIDGPAAIAIGAALDLGTNVTEKTTATAAFGFGVPSPGNGDITVAAPISWSSSARLTLDAFHDIDIDASIDGGSAGKVVLTSGGGISQAAGSVITAGVLMGSANGGVSLGGANQVIVLGPFTNSTIGDFNFTDARSFATSGTLSSFGSLTLTAGAGDSLTVGGALTAGANVNLNMGGTITQSAGSVITATTLTGSSVGGATLDGANLVANLGPFSDTGSGNTKGFSFTNAQALLTIGTVQSTGPLALTTTVGSLTLDADVTAPGGGVTLNSAGGITQLAGIIDPDLLLIKSVGSVSLTDANTVEGIAARITGVGSTLTFNDTATNLTVINQLSGVTTNNGDIVLQTTTSGVISIDGNINAGTGTVTAAASGDLGIGAASSVVGNGGVTLSTQRNFFNAAGASAITVGAGSRWLVYSSNPNADTDDGLTPNFIQYAATYDVATLTGTAPATTGNGFLYSLAPAAVKVTGVTKTYDGTTGLSGASFTASGAVVGDTVALGGSPTGSFAGKDAGTGIDVTVSGLTVTATRGGIKVFGYTVASVSNDPIGTIDPKTLTAGLTGTVTKTYDGTTVATLTGGNYTLTGVIAGDAVTLNDPTKGTYATAAVGSGIAVTVGGLALLGAEAGDYRLASATTTADIGKITAAPPPPPPPPPPPHKVLVLPPTFIPVVPSTPAQASAKAAASDLVVPRPSLNDAVRLSGCSGEDFVAVVPEADGHVGAVVVESEGNKTLLHAAYAGCSGSKPVMTNAAEVNRFFGGALAARPMPPVSYELYYNSGSVTLTPNALAVFDKVFAEIMRRKAAEVVVAGYTDTVGNANINDRLSLVRAQAASKLLLARGVAPGAITVLGRGERDLLVPTGDHVAEPQNRRVEITVR